MIQYFTPSDNENEMREVLTKFEDSKFFQDDLSLNIKFKTLKLVHIYLHFGIFLNGVSQFSNEEFDSSNDNEIDFQN